MEGQRIYPSRDGQVVLKAGDYVFLQDERIWLGKSPNGHCCNLGNHAVVEHEDGTITVTPSILISDSDGPVYHGFLERGVWREA